jgi:hypothetical protein
MIAFYLTGYAISAIITSVLTYGETKKPHEFDHGAAYMTGLVASLGWPWLLYKALFLTKDPV